MTQKKTSSPLTQKLHIFAENVSNVKIVVGAFIVVFGTIVSVAFGAINYVVNIKNAPIIDRVEAIESKQIIFEQALVGFKSDNTKQHDTIEAKLDKLLFKLVPNASNGSR